MHLSRQINRWNKCKEKIFNLQIFHLKITNRQPTMPMNCTKSVRQKKNIVPITSEYEFFIHQLYQVVQP